MSRLFYCFSGNTSSEICFRSKSGPLIARRNGDMITLDFPLSPTEKMVSIFFIRCNGRTVESKQNRILFDEIIKEYHTLLQKVNVLKCIYDAPILYYVCHYCDFEFEFYIQFEFIGKVLGSQAMIAGDNSLVMLCLP